MAGENDDKTVEEMTDDEFDALVSAPDITPDESEDKEAEDTESEDKESEDKEAEDTESEDKEAEDTESEDKEAEDKEDEGEPKAKRRNFMIPKSRYDAQKAQTEAARLRAAELENELAATKKDSPKDEPTAEEVLDQQLADIDLQVAKAQADNDSEAVVKLMKQARQVERQYYDNRLAQTTTTAVTSTREQVAYDMMLTAVEKAVPAINPDSEAFDEDVTNEVALLVDAFVSSGSSRRAALERALNYVQPDGWGEVEGDEVDEVEEEQKDVKPKVTPRKTNIEKNIDTAKKQAPVMKDGANSDTAGSGGKIDITRMTDAELDKLTEEEWDRAAEQ